MSRPHLPVMLTARGLGRAVVSTVPPCPFLRGPHAVWPRCHSHFQTSVFVPGFLDRPAQPHVSPLEPFPMRTCRTPQTRVDRAMPTASCSGHFVLQTCGQTRAFHCFAFLGEPFIGGTVGSTDLWAPSTEGSACPAGWEAGPTLTQSQGRCWLGSWHEVDTDMPECGEGLRSQPQMMAVKATE